LSKSIGTQGIGGPQSPGNFGTAEGRREMRL